MKEEELMQGGLRPIKIKRRILSILLALSMCFYILPGGLLSVRASAYSGGSGTKNDPYLISTREDFEAIADAVNSGDDLLGVYFRQTGDIDLGGEDNPWPTIGITIANTAHPFRGVFDGDQKAVTGLYVDRGDDDAGLFGYLGENGVIRNVNVIGASISGTYWVGGIASRNYGLIEYCSVRDSEVYGSQQYVGGIVGDNHGGKVRYCYNIGTYVESEQICGGVVGRNSGGTVENCYNTGEVCSTNAVRGYAGGVAGENTAGSTIDNCYSTGEVYGSMACGAIAGANGESSTVENCYYPEELEPGLGSTTGNVKNVSPKSDEDFASGEVAWELSQGNDGEGWGQNLTDSALDGGNAVDKHPHFTDMADKDDDTTPVFRVTFKSSDPYVDRKYYFDPGADVDMSGLPALPEGAKWYDADGNEFDGKNIMRNIDAVAGIRILFSAETGTLTAGVTYSTKSQTLVLNMDQYMEYEEFRDSNPSVEGRFEYTITDDPDGLSATLDKNGRTLTIPANANAKEDGYTLKITAHEKAPLIMPLSMSTPGTDDVELTLSLIIYKSTPVIVTKPDPSAIAYGQLLRESILSDGKAEHPVTAANVPGTFTWQNGSILPTVLDAANMGYTVLFTPSDTNNYNSVTFMLTLTVNKADPTILTEPVPIDRTYDGVAHELIIGGRADGGTMKYWIDGDNDNIYSSTIPSRTNAGTYKIWYMVVGDENHNDTEPSFVTAAIRPYGLTIPDQTFTYNGSTSFTVPLEGVAVENEDGSRNVIATLIPYTKNAGTYAFSDTAGSGSYTVSLSSPNYAVEQGGTLTINKLQAELHWNDPLTFFHDGSTKRVTATVNNAIPGDVLSLSYSGNEQSEEGRYTATVDDLGNNNYTLDGVPNKTQPWYIVEDNPNLRLTADNVTYSDQMTLTFTITPDLVNDAVPANVNFYVNGSEISSDIPVYYDSTTGIGTASTSVYAISAKKFFAGANALAAEFVSNSGNGLTAATGSVTPKPVTPVISSDDPLTVTKTYDGNNVAVGLDISLNYGEICSGDEVGVTADKYTYNDKNAGSTKTITAQNVTLTGSHSGNYFVKDPVTIIGSIDPKPIKLEWRGSTGLVYSGDPVNVNATARETLPGDSCPVIVENGNAVNAGSYTATAVSSGNSNYSLPTDDTTRQAYAIAKAKLYVPEQTVFYNGTNVFDAKAEGVTSAKGTAEEVDVRCTTNSPDIGEYAYYTQNSQDNTYTASTNNTNYIISGGAMLTIIAPDPSSSDTPVDPGDTTGPDDTDGSEGSGGSKYPGGLDGLYPGGSGSTIIPDNKDKNDNEDISADAAAYASAENISIAAADRSSAGTAAIISVVSAIAAVTAGTVFILKRKHSVPKGRHYR